MDGSPSHLLVIHFPILHHALDQHAHSARNPMSRCVAADSIWHLQAHVPIDHDDECVLAPMLLFLGHKSEVDPNARHLTRRYNFMFRWLLGSV